jgi:hypothetical protein
MNLNDLVLGNPAPDVYLNDAFPIFFETSKGDMIEITNFEYRFNAENGNSLVLS